MHISAQLIESFPTEYGSWSCAKKKLLIPLGARGKPSFKRNFSKFSCKNLKSCNFLSFGPSCWNCIFKLSRSRAFQRRTVCPTSTAKKSCGSHLFWVGPGEVDETAFVQELSKAVTFFVLRSILVKFHIQTGLIESFPMPYRLWRCTQEKLHLTPFLPLRQLKRDERLFPPLWRVVEFRARYG